MSGLVDCPEIASDWWSLSLDKSRLLEQPADGEASLLITWVSNVAGTLQATKQ